MSEGSNTQEVELKEEVASLRQKLAEVSVRLLSLEGENGDGKVESRRGVLKMAGAAALGAAGTLVLRATPASATVAGNVVLGAASPPNDSNLTTHLGPTGTGGPSPIVQVQGQTVPTGTGFPLATAATSKTAAVSLPVLLVVAPDAVFPNNGAVTPQAVYPGNAPLQSIGGVIDVASGGNTFHVSEGVDGFGARDPNDTWARGVGVAGESDFGVGVVGSGETDLAALGSGYISQASIQDVNGANIAGPPAAPPPYNFAQVRDMNGVMWISNPVGAWRRMNTIVPINPFRIYDSRPNARPAGSVTDIQVAGVNGIPTDAIGVLGNLTALSPAADGFLTMYPQGTPLAGTNSLNYTRGISALSNHVTVGLGSTGAVSVYVSGNGSTKFLFDVVGYIQ